LNSTQTVIAVSFTFFSAISLAIAWRVLRSTTARARRTPADIEKIRERENVYAIGIVVALIALLALTIFSTPYGNTKDADAQQVQVDSFQFGWTLTPNQVKAGEPVQFNTRSKDVQHGFGIYDGTKLISQVQVPGNRPGGDSEFGATQSIVETFDEPGTYEVLCLEFCGVKHQDMAATFEVVP
jgi:cytochrome c oxidase subunit 2